jgi:hypothetical protein
MKRILLAAMMLAVAAMLALPACSNENAMFNQSRPTGIGTPVAAWVARPARAAAWGGAATEVRRFARHGLTVNVNLPSVRWVSTEVGVPLHPIRPGRERLQPDHQTLAIKTLTGGRIMRLWVSKVAAAVASVAATSCMRRA